MNEILEGQEVRKVIRAVLFAALYLLVLIAIPNAGLRYAFQLMPEGLLRACL